MAEYFKIKKVRYEGPGSKNDFAFKFYDPERIVSRKKMKEHLPFAMAWWHNLGNGLKDIFGDDTADKTFGASEKKTMEHARAKADAGFEMMEKLGIEYFCFHDLDLVPEADDIKETNRRLDEIADYILEKMEKTNIKCLWGPPTCSTIPGI
jgi:xylose isomerase